MFDFRNKREIYRKHLSHTVRCVALSIISIDIPIYLLAEGYLLQQVIIFYITFHLAGLFFVFLVLLPLINNYGLVRTLKLHYPLEIGFLVLLHLLVYWQIPIYLIAIIGGFSTFSYWIPLNILLVKHAERKSVGKDISTFVALPKIFGILGPLMSAVLIPILGFGIVFVLAILGMISSYLPIANISKSDVRVDIKVKDIISKMKKRKSLFVLEIFNNMMEDSEWFWAIFVYLIIGSLAAPGIVGSMSALGGALFTLLIGKHVNKKAKIIAPVAALGMALLWGMRIFIDTPFAAYLISLVASFVMIAFLVSYFVIVYRNIKDKDEEEFLILKEVPTVLGRLILFSGILIFIESLRFSFAFPIIAAIILMFILIFRNRLKID